MSSQGSVELSLASWAEQKRKSVTELTDSDTNEFGTGRKKRRLKLSASVVNNAPTERLDVYVFGDNTYGQLGLGEAGKDHDVVVAPTRNTNLAADRVGIVQLAAGGAHCAALTHDNKIRTWGANDEGALGRETRPGKNEMQDNTFDADEATASTMRERTPMEVDPKYFPLDTVFTQVVATESATFVLTEEGTVYGWGTFKEREEKGQDDAQTETKDTVIGFSPRVTYQLTPVRLRELSNVKTLVAGAQHVLALTSRGAVFAWGASRMDQLGRRVQGRMRQSNSCLIPRQCALPMPNDIVKIGAGAYHSFAIRENGDVFAWGWNEYAQTGIPLDVLKKTSTVRMPTEVWKLRNHRVCSLAGGKNHSVAVTEDGRCLSWGSIEGSATGIQQEDMDMENVLDDAESGEPRAIAAPTLVSHIDGKVTFVTTGPDHSIVITRKGHVYGWGSNGQNEAGLSPGEQIELPTLIDSQGVTGKVVSAAAGNQFTVLLVEH